MYRTVIIEDESLIAKELQYKLSELAKDIEVIQILPSLKKSINWFDENPEPDIIFADIQLSDGISFEIFRKFDFKCPVIFTTAYDEYALQAFKVNGTDYLLKPVDMEELQRALNKCRLILNTRSEYPKDFNNLMELFSKVQSTTINYKEKFIVQHRKHWLPVLVKDIACFRRDSLNFIYTFSGERFVLDFATLEEVEEVIDPKIFFRANRQTIINVAAIQSITPFENQKLSVKLIVSNVQEVDVSREKAPIFKKWLDR
ncbi:MAG: response regulator transcription factor [Saprospiraceae bacterium]|jgi:DNA-binding LytR/AlgR family response regulator|nr:response regulator transcription factor [Saprospiraceae bacterium]